MITVKRTYRFESAHRLPLVPEHHKCHRLHGHNYRIEIAVSGELADGMVLDFFDMDRQVLPLLDLLDHNYLNDVPDLDNPTAENIALWFVQRLPFGGLESVTVWETDDCCAVWTE